jgi:hypothetical protein
VMKGERRDRDIGGRGGEREKERARTILLSGEISHETCMDKIVKKYIITSQLVGLLC